MKPPVAVLLTIFSLTGHAQPGQIPVRFPARGTRGAVTGGTEYATEAGMRLLTSGGNAVDAGIATMLAASVTEFSHFGFGGESPILVRTKAGKVFAIAGVLSALVPGMVDAALVTLQNFGTKSFAETVQPAIELADGFPIDEYRATMGSMSIRGVAKYLEMWPSSKHVYLPNGNIPRAGDIFRQPDLARTLRAMAAVETKTRATGATREKAMEAVRDFFYRGEIAHKID